MGTGGAFIAIADDATAATWNPAGLVQLLVPEMSMVATNENRRLSGDDFSFTEINYLSVVVPFSLGRLNVVAALNYQRMYDFYFQDSFDVTQSWSDPSAEMVDSSVGLVNSMVWTYNERKVGQTNIMGGLGALSPAIAFQVTPSFSIGFTYNFWSDDFITLP
jgi:hypothetical protein